MRISRPTKRVVAPVCAILGILAVWQGACSASLVPKEAAAVGMSYNALCEEIVQQSYRLKRRT